jgi:hypothetical protein
MFCGRWLALHYLIVFCFIFPFARFVFLPEPLGILWMQHTVAGIASCDGFSCQLLFHGKEEFAGNTFQAAGSSAATDLCI